MEAAFLSYRFNDAAQTVYEYFWNDFCDWYVEASKLSIKDGSDAEKDRATTVLLTVLEESLRLLHPLLPFVTEEIYGKLPTVKEGELLITAPYPEYQAARADPAAEKDFGFLQELVRMIRTLRSECTVTPDKRIHVLVRIAGSARADGGKADGAQAAFLTENAGLVKLLAGLSQLDVAEAVAAGEKKPAGSIGLAGTGFEAFVYIAEAVDAAALKQKFRKEIEKDRAFIAGLTAKLANGNFTKNAPPELVEAERRKLDEAQSRTGKLESWLQDMG
jgi:valyl-tRNA synthetase